MKRKNRIAVLSAAILCCAGMALAQSGPPQKVRIGVLDLQVIGGDETFAATASEQLANALTGMGSYNVFTQRVLEDAFQKVKLSFPQRCREPRCVIDIGSATGMDRMLYGRLDKNDNSYGVQLNLIDVQTRQMIGSLSLKSDPGVAPDALLKAAMAKLHGKQDADLSIKVATYFGPDVHNEKELAISSGVCMGAGLIWALANGGFKGMGAAPTWKAEALSGISAAADRIPMAGRPAALANSYLAVSDDAYGVLYNPAGMAWVAGREAAISYQYRFGLLNNVTASYVNKATRDIGVGNAILYSGDNDTSSSMTEMYYITAVAYKFNQLLSFMRPVSAGAAIKVSTKTASGNADATAGEKTFGFGIDIGVLWELSNQIRYGAVIKDLLAFDRVNNTVGEYSYTEMMPVTLAMGGLFKAGYTTNLMANGQIPLYKDQPWKMAGGIEQEFFRIIKARVGIEKEIQALVDTPWKFTGGLGLDANTESLLGRRFCFDASYEYNTLSLLYVLNMSMRFAF